MAPNTEEEEECKHSTDENSTKVPDSNASVENNPTQSQSNLDSEKERTDSALKTQTTSTVTEHSEVAVKDYEFEHLIDFFDTTIDYDISLDNDTDKSTQIQKIYLQKEYPITDVNNDIQEYTKDIPVIGNYAESTTIETAEVIDNEHCIDIEKTDTLKTNACDNSIECETNVNCCVSNSIAVKCTQHRNTSIRPFVVRVQRLKTPTIASENANEIDIAKQNIIANKARKRFYERHNSDQNIFNVHEFTQTPYNFRPTDARTKLQKKVPNIAKMKQNNKKQKNNAKKFDQEMQSAFADFIQNNGYYRHHNERKPKSSLKNRDLLKNYQHYFGKSNLKRLLATEISNQNTGCHYCRPGRHNQNHPTRRDLLHHILRNNIYQPSPELMTNILRNLEERESDLPTSSSRATTKRLLESVKIHLKRLTSLVTYLDVILSPHADDMLGCNDSD